MHADASQGMDPVAQRRALAVEFRVLNARGSRLAALLTLVLYPAFWWVDWLIFPDLAWATAAVRLPVIAFAVATLVVIHCSGDFSRRARAAGALCLSAAGAGVTVMCWLHAGLASPYYAGLALVLLAAGQLFYWSVRAFAFFSAVQIGCFLLPTLVLETPRESLPIVASNLMFLASTLVITGVGQYSRVRVATQRFLSNLQLQHLREKLQELAQTDSLTGLPNRRHFEVAAVKALEWAAAHGQAVALLLLDIDRFKAVNDRHGHPVGDEVLRACARVMTEAVRDVDVVARIGGEEFAVVLTNIHGVAHASATAERLRDAIARMQLVVGSQSLATTVSVGLRVVEHPGTSLEGLLRQADASLYQAKRNGRNRVCVWDASMGS